MNQNFSNLTHSKFYSPAFNAAIFDGPVRIYFAQYQEMLGLKLYFHLQQRLLELHQKIKEVHKNTGLNIFIMLYPTEDTFRNSFEKSLNTDKVLTSELEGDLVFGVNGALEENDFNLLFDQVMALLPSTPAVQPRVSEASL